MNYKILILSVLGALEVACGTVNTLPPLPNQVVQTAKAEPTPCDLADRVDNYAGYKIIGKFPHNTFFAQAVGIENRTIEVEKRIGPDGQARYFAHGTMPAPYSVLLGPSRDKVLDYLREADLADGKEDHCIITEGIQKVMNRVYEEYATTTSEPVQVRVIEEHYGSSSTNGQSKSYHRSEKIINGKKTVKEEIVGGKGVSGKCGWNYRREVGDCDWSRNRKKGDCDWDFRTDGKSQSWLDRCLGEVKTNHDSCISRAENSYHKCQEE